MATDDKPEDDDPMAAWAEALEEQKVSDTKVEGDDQGGPLFGGNGGGLRT